MLDRINAKGIESGRFNPVFVDFYHLLAHIGRFRLEVGQAGERAEDKLRLIVEVLQVPVVVEKVDKRWIGGV